MAILTHIQCKKKLKIVFQTVQKSVWYYLTPSDKKCSLLTTILYVDLWHLQCHKLQHIVDHIILVPDKDVRDPPTLALLHGISEI